MAPNRTLAVDIYVRVSRVGGREHLTSPDDQEREARAFAATRGLTIGRVIQDIDVSGGTLDRPGLQESLERVERRESGGIVVAYLSRASRDTAQGLALLERIRHAGGAVYAPNLPDYTTPDGEMLTTIQLAVDTGYRRRKTVELERAKAGAIERGIPVSTRAPVGYRKRADRRYEPDPQTAPVIRELFERRAAGAGPAELIALLDAAGIPTTQGGEWTKQAVYGVLSCRTYLGELSYGRDRRYVNLAAHEPLVDLALWTAAQHPNGRLQPVGEMSAWLLTGLARCAACRYCLQGTTTSRGNRIYRCTRTHSGGTCPAPTRVDADTLERDAIAAFWKVTADLEARGGVEPVDLSGLEADVERTSAALRHYMAPEVQDAIGDPALWAEGLQARREAREEAAQALGQARAAIVPADDVPDVETLRGAWERMSTRDRRELLGLRFDALAVGRDPYTVRAFTTGTAPRDLPRRGYKAGPVLAPFPAPRTEVVRAAV